MLDAIQTSDADRREPPLMLQPAELALNSGTREPSTHAA